MVIIILTGVLSQKIVLCKLEYLGGLQKKNEKIQLKSKSNTLLHFQPNKKERIYLISNLMCLQMIVIKFKSANTRERSHLEISRSNSS